MMRLHLLGTSAAQPTSERSLSCICIERDGEIIMFDAGEGAQNSFQKSGLGWNKKMKILVTHLHGDHCIGILGILQTMTLQRRTESLEIYGPNGIEEFITQNIKILNFGLTFPVLITTVKNDDVIEEEKYKIRICNANHSVMALSYVFQENEKPGKFFSENAINLGIPKGNLWHKLQTGNEIEINGKKIKPSQVLGQSKPGKKIGISGDTRPTDDLANFFTHCDYLIFDSTFTDDLKQKALQTFHSTAKEAAIFAQNANVTNLILTHFSARYKNEDLHLQEAKKEHNSVITAKDLLRIDII